MIQMTPQMRILVALEPIDGRKGIDSLARLCQDRLADDPFSGCIFIFITRSRVTIKILCYDGQGFWLAQKRLSQGRFKWWPQTGGRSHQLEPFQAQLLLAACDPAAQGAPVWRSVRGREKFSIPERKPA
jgi:transposase